MKTPCHNLRLLLLAGLTTWCSMGLQAPGGDERPTLSAAKSRDEAGAIIRKLITAASDRELQIRKHSGDDAVALRAQWELISRRMLTKESNRWLELPETAAHRFLGVLEGRMRVDVPREWEKILLSKSLSFEVYGIDYEMSLTTYSLTGMDTFCSRKGVSMKKEDDGVVVRKGRRSIVLSAALFDSLFEEGGGELIDVLFIGQRCYVSFHHRSALPYQLSCIDTNASVLVWKTQVWAGCFHTLGGFNLHDVTLVQQSDKIAVFGVATFSMYAETFDAATGKDICRFTTCDYSSSD